VDLYRDITQGLILTSTDNLGFDMNKLLALTLLGFVLIALAGQCHEMNMRVQKIKTVLFE
jgi:hypothetical protein